MANFKAQSSLLSRSQCDSEIFTFQREK